jgi:hypothetical protein
MVRRMTDWSVRLVKKLLAKISPSTSLPRCLWRQNKSKNLYARTQREEEKRRSTLSEAEFHTYNAAYEMSR